MKLTKRQEQIIEIIKRSEPIRSQDIADKIGVAQVTARQDLAILTSLGLVDGKPNHGYTFKKDPSSTLTKKINQTKVKDIMKDAIAVNESKSVYDASIEMIVKDTGSLFVVDNNGFLVGIISRKDLLKNTIHGTDTRSVPVGVVMTRQPLYKVTTNDSIADASKIIVEKEVDAIPVVETKNGKDILLGKITKTSISEVFVRLLDK